MARLTFCNAALFCLGLALAACEEDMEPIVDGGSDSDAGEDAGADAGEDAGRGGDAAPTTREIELQFEARVGSAVFDCTETYDQIGTSKVRVSMSDFRFYVYDVRLIDEADREVPLELTQDGQFQLENVALLDFENRTGSCVNGTPDTNALVKGVVPEGRFKGLRFGVGVPNALNHSDVAATAAPLNLTAMAWTWQLGRLFTRIDARVETSSGNRPTFVIHVGSNGCQGNPAAGQTVTCARPNRAAIELTDFDPENDKIVLDYAKLVANVAVDQDQGGESGCMASVSDPECQSLFEQLGLDLQSGSPGSSAQVVFGAEPK
jgi:uncharacterized repeat protein (TIGR04052 family)